MDIRIADRLEIADLFARLGRLLDEARPDDAHTVYSEDVEVRSPRGRELHGLEAVTTYLRASQVVRERTQHVHGDVLVDLHADGRSATASANQLVFFHPDGEALVLTSGLRVTCTAVRTPAGWRFGKAEIALAWTAAEQV